MRADHTADPFGNVVAQRWWRLLRKQPVVYLYRMSVKCNAANKKKMMMMMMMKGRRESIDRLNARPNSLDSHSITQNISPFNAIKWLMNSRDLTIWLSLKMVHVNGSIDAEVELKAIWQNGSTSCGDQLLTTRECSHQNTQSDTRTHHRLDHNIYIYILQDQTTCGHWIWFSSGGSLPCARNRNQPKLE